MDGRTWREGGQAEDWFKSEGSFKGEPSGWRRGEEWGDCWRQRPPAGRQKSATETHTNVEMRGLVL